MWLLWSHFPTYLPPSFFPLSTFHSSFKFPFSLLILSQTGWPLALLSYHTFSNSFLLTYFVPNWLTSCSSFIPHLFKLPFSLLICSIYPLANLMLFFPIPPDAGYTRHCSNMESTFLIILCSSARSTALKESSKKKTVKPLSVAAIPHLLYLRQMTPSKWTVKCFISHS